LVQKHSKKQNKKELTCKAEYLQIVIIKNITFAHDMLYMYLRKYFYQCYRHTNVHINKIHFLLEKNVAENAIDIMNQLVMKLCKSLPLH